MPSKCGTEYDNWLEAYQDLDTLEGELADNEAEFDKIWDDSWDETKDYMVDAWLYGIGYSSVGHPELGLLFEVNKVREAINALNKTIDASNENLEANDKIYADLLDAKRKEDLALYDFCVCLSHYNDP